MPDPLAQFRWLEGYGLLEQIFCVSFFHRLGPAEVLRRFGAASTGQQMPFEELRYQVGEYVTNTGGGYGGGYVGVVPVGKWSVAIELWGWQATLFEVVNGLSRASKVVAISRHDYAEDSFVYAIDGTIATSFMPRQPSRRHGTDPERLNALMREVGLDPQQKDGAVENSIAAAFALAAKITGVAFTSSILKEALLVGDIRN